jgi:PST family polysaccharide transporter
MNSTATSEPVPATTGTPAGKSSYGQILKSSALIGGSSIIGFVISAVRTKLISVLLGPTGIGLNGLLYSIQDLANCLVGMGISTSGVRQIAAGVGSGDDRTVARTVLVLRRTSIVLGILGAILVAGLAKPIAEFSFTDQTADTGKHTLYVALVGIAVMVSTISAGQGAVLQGMRRIQIMAWCSVVTAIISVFITLPLIYFLKSDGIPLAMITTAAVTCSFSWYFSRQIPLVPVQITGHDVRQEAGALFKLGLAFLGSGILTMGAGYMVRTMVSRMDGLDAAGFYQAAWAIAAMYTTVVLQAMGADFYPRLTGVANDDSECNRLVNEQAQVSLLLSGPGLIATLTLAPLVISIFNSPKFMPAVEPLRWICLGMALRVIAWPLGFVIIAKAQQVKFIVTEILATVVHVGGAYIGIKFFGVRGAGMAFLGLYVVHCCVIYWLVRRTTHFRWSPENIRVGTCVLGLTLASFLAFEFVPFWPATIFGLLAATASGIYALRRLTRLVPLQRLPSPVRKIVILLKIAPPESGR